MSSVLNIFEPAPPAKAELFDLDRLTSEFRAQRNTDWSIAEAFLCLLLSAAAADGKFALEEQAEIKALAGRSRALKSVGEGGLAAANAKVSQKLAQRPAGVQEACLSLPSDMRLSVFAHCVDIILSDGDLAAPEADFLNKIASFMGLDPADAKRVMEVLLVKNKF